MGLHIISTILAFLSHANRAYSTLTRQLKTVIIELSMAQVLWLRTNPWRMHEIPNANNNGITAANSLIN